MIYTAWLYKYLLIYTIYISVDDTQCMGIYIYLLTHTTLLILW